MLLSQSCRRFFPRAGNTLTLTGLSVLMVLAFSALSTTTAAAQEAAPPAAGSASAAPTPAPAPTPTPVVSTTPTPAGANDKDVTPEKTFEFGGGYLLNLQKHGTNSSYYTLKYNGQTLSAKGTAFAAPSLTGPNLPAVAASGGDTHDFELRLEHGAAQVHGGVLDSIFQKPLNISFLKNFRGTVGVNSTQDFKQIVYSGGLESPAIHPLRLLGLDRRKHIINWLFVGAVNENSNVSGSGNSSGNTGESNSESITESSTGSSTSSTTGTSTDAGVAIYRGFIGRGFLPVISGAEQKRVADAEKNRQDAKTEIQKYSEKNGVFDLATLEASASVLETTSGFHMSKLTDAQKVIVVYGGAHGLYNANPEMQKATADWETYVKTYFFQEVERNPTSAEMDQLKAAGEKNGQFDLPTLIAAEMALPSQDPHQLTGVNLVIYSLAHPGGDLNPTMPDTIAWEKTAFAALGALGDPVEDLASVQTWFDSTGWYQFTRLSSGSLNKRYTNLLSANVKVYLNAKQAANNWLLFRFERGTERSAPDVYKNSLSASIGFNF